MYKYDGMEASSIIPLRRGFSPMYTFLYRIVWGHLINFTLAYLEYMAVSVRMPNSSLPLRIPGKVESLRIVMSHFLER